MGARKDGTITAILFRTYKDIGGYGNPIGGTCVFWEEIPAISYKAENGRFEGWDVHVNHFSTQPYCGVASITDNFAMEQVIDQVAEKLGINPVEFRLKNMPETGDVMPVKPYSPPVYYPTAKLATYPAKKLIQEVVKKADFGSWKGWGKPLATERAKRRGIGVAYSVGEAGFCFESAMTMAVVLNKDGSVNIISGAQDIGTGLNTTLCMLAAELLGIPLEDVDICTGDTSTGQYDFFGARSSRELVTGGYLLLAAIEDAKRKIRQITARRLKVKPENIEVKGKKAFIKGKEEEAVPLSELIATSVVGSYEGPQQAGFQTLVADCLWPGVKVRRPHAMIAEVEVDIETGEVKPLKLVVGDYIGKMINEAVVKGQYTGGAMRGLGAALYEEFNYNEANSTYLSCSLTDYKVPRALDTPTIDTVILEEAQEYSPHMKLPYGALGVGEMGQWGPLACIANAIYNAIGVRVRKAPMTPEVILEALGKETGR
jgi:xanthine dehydrogenase molybdenum-binding subunit